MEPWRLCVLLAMCPGVLAAQGNRTIAVYDHGDLAAVRDPLGRVTRYLTDGAGRLAASVSS